MAIEAGYSLGGLAVAAVVHFKVTGVLHFKAPRHPFENQDRTGIGMSIDPQPTSRSKSPLLS